MKIVCCCGILLTQLILCSATGYHPAYSVFFGGAHRNAYYRPQFQQQTAPVVNTFDGSNAIFGNGIGSPPRLAAQQVPSALDPSGMGCGTPPATCTNSRYRSFDGSCNNLRNPVWGTPNTRYGRLLPPNYGDGISLPTRARSGNPLPLSRTVSLIMYPDINLEDPIFTLNAMQYGQIVTHDMSMIAGSTQAQPHSTMCCSASGQLLELANIPEHCFPIVLPESDPIAQQTNQRCQNFVRTITDRDRNCVAQNQPAEQLTAVNAFLDLSIVYGNNDQTAQSLRQFQGGLMTVDVRNGQTWPPRNMNSSGVCAIQDINEACYMAGDTRVNQNPQLTLLQVVLLREHNRLANALAQINSHWDDETLFQEARKINIAQHQYITYYEWLPIYIGFGNSLKNRIIYQTSDFVNDYDDTVDPSILNEHATAAFRFFHSLIQGNLDLVTEERNSYGTLRLSDWFNRPQIIEERNNFDDLSRGLNTQPQDASDQFHTSEITQFLFRAGQQFGQDLKAFDVQRNRDHGLASYNEVRQFCGLPRANSFNDFLDVMSSKNVEQLARLYESPEDVDLTVGGSLEQLVPGTLAGPTFLCILTEQFYRYSFLEISYVCYHKTISNRLFIIVLFTCMSSSLLNLKIQGDSK
ncbi:unnamed protein product [Acanthoscelides obtectus]|uniref:Peroxidase n=1 Tax=Acanthoscelides obtectus TaxID=200917 RepID=A0A9P0NYW4_ACAOB|nr:unnamed protein product [Acanthoscelides obtectus]CAK1632021.1 Peroxidase [Acanthoscelides obtectus]